MKQLLLDYWYLFQDPFIASLLVGIILPLIGGLLLLRRAVFLGVAVPQFSAAGLAIGLWLLPWWPGLWQEFLDHGHPEMSYMFAFAGGGAVLALGAFSWWESRHRGGTEGLLAAGFAVASAMSLLFLSMGPLGANLVDAVLKGEILYLDHHGLIVLAVVLSLVSVILLAARRPILLIAFDPDLAATLGVPRTLFERLLWLCVGLSVGAGVVTVGPVLVFGLLFLPPLAARGASGSMPGFFIRCSLLGLIAVLASWPLCLWLEQPYGPTAVLLSGLLALCFHGISRLNIAKGPRY
ncbi:MAG: metal ABC transporter permease [Planctomycetota bacterium]|nr:MAG: metal ABC transporter permease [Planctomycetota bacterium]